MDDATGQIIKRRPNPKPLPEETQRKFEFIRTHDFKFFRDPVTGEGTAIVTAAEKTDEGKDKQN